MNLFRTIFAKYSSAIKLPYFIPDIKNYETLVREIIKNPDYTGYEKYKIDEEMNEMNDDENIELSSSSSKDYDETDNMEGFDPPSEENSENKSLNSNMDNNDKEGLRGASEG